MHLISAQASISCSGRKKKGILNNQKFASTSFVSITTNSEHDTNVGYVELFMVFSFPVGGPSASYTHRVILIIRNTYNTYTA